ncbi:alpha/beta fold hydrolase [Streptomyces niveiscabiei]|uniref:alpha/beta fold hydrolase n=1 Tax=Streptomyces niveiscabiei TaxID=164115 RepID=UPI0029BCAEC0|nr:alpha/beta fold hydrolase [Streptomyces niveiscabiei]MDX3382014.1 alpha/beta fold hydrolase [Streptomyces niveiscabiei]
MLVTLVVTVSLLGAGTAAPALDPARFGRQRVVWSACEDQDVPKDLECGKVTVPLDHARPGAGTLELALARYRATGEKHGSVVLDFGGPGAPGVPELAYSRRTFADLTNHYDVVSFDPRGVGRSSPVSCGDWASDEEEVTGDDPGALLARLRKIAGLCARHSGPVLPYVGTVFAARDLDVIRSALGERKLNYLGFSYGSRLGAVYAAQFPRRVGRLALDGVDTLTEPVAEQGIAGARGQQVALDGFTSWCARGPACPLGEEPRAAREEVVRLVRSLDAHPVRSFPVGEFTGQDLVGALGQALYRRDWWPALRVGLTRLTRDGDPSGVQSFAAGGISLKSPTNTPGSHLSRPLKGIHTPLTDPADVPLDNMAAALMAIDCADDPDRPTARRITEGLPALRASFQRASPVFGPYRLAQTLMCYGRPRGTEFIREDVKDLRTPKLLLVGTRGDPATPYRWTTETAARLGGAAVVLDNRGEGHTGYASSRCVRRKVNDFLLYGSLPPSGSSCGADEEPRPSS